MSADPLSFFGGEVSDSDSDESGPEEIQTKTQPDIKERKGGLPHPLAALSSATTPKFVTSHVNKDMNWDTMVKKAPYVAPKEYKPWENALPSVESKPEIKTKKPDLALNKQVPQNLVTPSIQEPVVKKQENVNDFAISWSKMYQDSSNERPKKRLLPQDEDRDLVGFCHTDVDADKLAFSSVKQQKMNSFRVKEKVKRDTGQANREKMFVEEEKRILRQNFD